MSMPYQPDVPTASESPDIRYGRALEGAHLSGYARDRAAREVIHLLESGDWRHVGHGFLDPSEFVRTIPFGEFGASRQLVVAYERAARTAGATYPAIGDSRGVSAQAVWKDLAPESTQVEAETTETPDLSASRGVELTPESTQVEAELEDTPLWPEKEPEAAFMQAANDADGLREAFERLADGEEPEQAPPAPPKVQVNEGDEWYTPRWLFDALGIKFSIDVCAPLDQTHSTVPAEQHFTIEDDGLAQPWHGTVWCNPPYSKPEPWARRMIHHRDGLLLTHMPMNAGWCVDTWEACDAIRLFQAMEFVRPDGSVQRPGYWLQLTAFGPVATEALARLQPLGDAAANKRRIASPMWRAVA